jgi:anti-sigma regulatory factor (Ser/Thr protein kinase)
VVAEPRQTSLGSAEVLSVDLPAEPASASQARALARSTLEATCPPEVLDTVALLVTELVTNAILHARTPLHLSIEVGRGAVRMCVEDGSTDRPVPQRYDVEAVTGRGLALVERLSTSWGIDATPEGKVVWCEVPTEVR